MGLRIKGSRKVGHNLATLMAVFALVFQPVSGFVAGQLASAVSEADIYVNEATDGTEANTYATINEAIDAASNNHVISVAAGEYDEKVAITKNITLRGEAGAIINGPDGSQAIEVRAQDNVLTNVTVSGLTVNAGANSLNVINVSNGTNFFRGNLLLENLTINGNNAPAGIGLMQTDGVTIDNATISNAKVGVEVVGAQNLKIQNSRIENATTGIHVWNTTGYGPRNNTLNLTGNTLTNNATGIKIDNARNVTISGGAITGGHSAVSAKDSQTLKINGVTMSGQSSLSNLAVVGLIGAVEYAEITGNTIKDAQSTEATAQAILLGDTGTSGNLRYVTIDGNTLQNVSGARGGYGLMVNRPMSSEAGAQLKFTNNTVDNIHGNDWMAGIGLDRQTPNAEIVGNTFSNLSTNSTEWPVVAVNVNHRTGNGADVNAMTIKQNNFNTPDQLGVNYDWATGTSPAASKYLDASENYWGDLPGPAKGSSATAGQYVKYSNWLCGPGQSTLTSDNGESKGCVQPIVTSVEPGQSPTINGVKRIYINVSNPEVMNGGFLQLNRATPAPGVHPNDGRTNYPIKQDNEGRWYAEVDTTNIVALNGSGHQGDGNYLFRVEAHHKYGHSDQHPWGNYGNNPAWNSPIHHFVVDNTAPEVVSATLNGAAANIAPRNKNVGPTDFNLVGAKFTFGLETNDATDTTFVRYRVAKVNSSGGTVAQTYRSNWFNMTSTDGTNWTAAQFDTATVGSVHPNSSGDRITDGTYTIQIETRDSLGNTFDHRYVDLMVDLLPSKVVVESAVINKSAKVPDDSKHQRKQSGTGGGASGTFGRLAGGIPGILGASDNFFGTAANPAVANQANDDSTEPVDVLSETDEADGSEVQGSLVDDTEVEEGCASFLGLCWYWWVLIVVAVITAAVLIRRAISTNESEHPRGL